MRASYPGTSSPLEPGRIREAPILAYAPMQPLGAALGRLDRQRLQSVRLQILALLLQLLGFFADPRARCHHEDRQVIAAVLRIQDVIAEAKPVFTMLPAEPTSRNALSRSSERPLSAKSFSNMTG